MKPAIEVTARTAHEPSYGNPIVIRVGDLLETFGKDSKWPGWIWCRHPDGRSGWVPERILRINGSGGIALEDYSARELSTNLGERLVLLRTESGWGWCRSASGDEGWVPLGALNSETT